MTHFLFGPLPIYTHLTTVSLKPLSLSPSYTHTHRPAPLEHFSRRAGYFSAKQQDCRLLVNVCLVAWNAPAAHLKVGLYYNPVIGLLWSPSPQQIWVTSSLYNIQTALSVGPGVQMRDSVSGWHSGYFLNHTSNSLLGNEVTCSLFLHSSTPPRLDFAGSFTNHRAAAAEARMVSLRVFKANNYLFYSWSRGIRLADLRWVCRTHRSVESSRSPWKH